MALTLKEILSSTQEKYKLKLLAAHNALDFVVTWVHMLEDTRVTEFFWGNEIAVTSGYATKTEKEMLNLVDVLEKRRCAGLVINMGQYINEIPQSVIDHCEELNLPLLTMPWQMYMTEFVRECCSQINQSDRNEEQLAQMVLHVVQSPQDAGALRDQLEEHFREEAGFQMLAVRAALPGNTRNNVIDHRSTLRLHTALRPYDFPYLIFRHEKRYLILMNEQNITTAQELAKRIIATIRISLPDLPVQIGVSDPVKNYEQLTNCFHGAISACRRASIQKLDIVCFRDMGFYKLLYSVPDDALLMDYYNEVMSPLLDYDQKGGGDYTETLIRYLLANGSLQTVANEMFTHRNTINYRMGKIRELLGSDLATTQDRLPYLLAYHIGVILRLTEEYTPQ